MSLLSLGTDTFAANTAVRTQTAASMAMDADGNFVVAWMK